MFKTEMTIESQKLQIVALINENFVFVIIFNLKNENICCTVGLIVAFFTLLLKGQREDLLTEIVLCQQP